MTQTLQELPLYGPPVPDPEQEIFDCKLITETKKGTRVKNSAILRFHDNRIWFLKSPFSLKDEIKSMKGSKWHGYDDPPQKIWSIQDCPRNRFQLQYLLGGDPYEWFDQEIKEREFTRPLMGHQCELANSGLTYHYQIWAAEMGVGKTLSAISVMEASNLKRWFWVGPKAALKAIQREFRKWSLDPTIEVEMLTYEALVRVMDDWPRDKDPPDGVVFDESSRLKTESSQRTRAAQKLSDLIRYRHGENGYVILMSGTPSPKSPVDWWAQAEIAWPGFLREGSPKALEQRLAFMTDQQFDAGTFKQREGWKDNADKCDKCGLTEEDGPHELELVEDPKDYHPYAPSKNEVALMYERLAGLVVVKHKKDCLSLPDKRYRVVHCKPTKSLLRVAQAIAGSAVNAVTGMTLLRELSDGFQYREEADGTTACDHCNHGEGSTGIVPEWFDPEMPERAFKAIDMLNSELVAKLEKRDITCPNCNGSKEVTKYVRVTREVPCPKEPALIELLEENEEHGRIVIAAGFTGSVDRCTAICLKNSWDVVRLDGRGFHVFRVNSDGSVETLNGVDALDYWADMGNSRVAFVMHPESGGLGLTLTEASMIVYWSNSFKPEYRIQSEDRIHRTGMDANRGATIVDLIHLPTDQRTLDVIRENRKLELLTMGELSSCFANAESSENGEIVDAAA